MYCAIVIAWLAPTAPCTPIPTEGHVLEVLRLTVTSFWSGGQCISLLWLGSSWRDASQKQTRMRENSDGVVGSFVLLTLGNSIILASNVRTIT